MDKISDQEVEKNSFIEGLKKFRPTQTIFEVESAAAHKFDSSFMNLKRKVHGVAIEKTRTKKTRTEELATIQADSNEDGMDSEEKLPSMKEEDSIYDDSTTVEEKDESEEGNSKKRKKNATFKDEQYYMSSIRQNHHFEKA